MQAFFFMEKTQVKNASNMAYDYLLVFIRKNIIIKNNYRYPINK